ncbi:MAG: hypothetical protein HQK56_11025 [Deltaproteobacteria bacterium]|nr:hypothetical protein [Deltaproteobacteria bacterium]
MNFWKIWPVPGLMVGLVGEYEGDIEDIRVEALLPPAISGIDVTLNCG